MFRRLMVLASTALITAALVGCQNSDTWVQAQAGTGWPAQYGDAANSSYTDLAGAQDLQLEWSRSVKGDLGAQVALSHDGYLAANAQSPGGCSIMVWESDNDARQRWCTRLVQGGGFAGPLFDGFDNVYVGEPGTMLSFPTTQWFRWRRPVIGMPTTPRFLEPNRLLVVTHLGQVQVFDAHNGTVVGTAVDLVEGLDPTDSQRGLSDCAQARPGCPVAAAPAFAAATDTAVVDLWKPGAKTPVLVGLTYRSGQTPSISRQWTSDAVGGGPLGSPVMSADGTTVYVNGRDKQLWALDAADGKPKWSVPLKYLAQTPPSVSPDGLIIAGGGPGSALVAVRDAGDHGEVRWRRDDVIPLTTASRAGEHIGYAVVRDTGPDGAEGLALLVFDPADGRTVNRYPLPLATGWPVGVSIGHDGRVVAGTSDGQVYGFRPNT